MLTHIDVRVKPKWIFFIPDAKLTSIKWVIVVGSLFPVFDLNNCSVWSDLLVNKQVVVAVGIGGKQKQMILLFYEAISIGKISFVFLHEIPECLYNVIQRQIPKPKAINSHLWPLPALSYCCTSYHLLKHSIANMWIMFFTTSFFILFQQGRQKVNVAILSEFFSGTLKVNQTLTFDPYLHWANVIPIIASWNKLSWKPTCAWISFLS